MELGWKVPVCPCHSWRYSQFDHRVFFFCDLVEMKGVERVNIIIQVSSKPGNFQFLNIRFRRLDFMCMLHFIFEFGSGRPFFKIY